MKCKKCGKLCEEVVQLTEYGRNRVNKNDNKEYCEGCFNDKYPHLHDRTENEKSNE